MEGEIMGFSWNYYTSDTLMAQEIENCIIALKKFALDNNLKYKTLPEDAKQFGPTYLIHEGTYKNNWIAEVDPSKLRGIFVIFPEPSISEAFDFVPNSQRRIAFASCKTFAREPEDTMVEKILQLLVSKTNGKLFATNDAFDLIGEPPEDWFTKYNPETTMSPSPKNEWIFHTKASLEPQEIEESINELKKFAHKWKLRYIILPASLEDFRKSKFIWSRLQYKGYTISEGIDIGSTPVNRNPRELKGIVIRVSNIEFEFIPNKNRYIAYNVFASNGRQVENEIAEEMLHILLRTTNGKLYAHLESKDGTKIIGELPEYHVKIKGVTNKRQEAF